MQAQVLAPYKAVSVGELSNTPLPKQVLPYVSAAARELDMVFEFSMIRLGTGNLFHGKYIYTPFTLSVLKRHVATWQTFIEGTDGWHTVFCENHDNGRAVSRFGDDSTPELWEASAKTIALWQATLTGTLFLYQGQEIGMRNMPASWGIDEYKDVESLGFYNEAVASGDGKRVQAILHGLRILARDHSRVPFQWDDSANAGFTGEGVTPWMRVHDQYRELNAANQLADPESVLGFYRKTLRLRKEYRDIFVHGAFKLLAPEDESLFMYVKEGEEQVAGVAGNRKKALVVMNFTSRVQQCPDISGALGCRKGDEGLLVSTLRSGQLALGRAEELRPWEGRVYLNFKPRCVVDL
jgi:alpha-glucosidase